jgi:predicted metal-dependent hydrolase
MTSTDEILTSYSVRRSRRAKHVRLKINPIDGLVVVVPTHFDERQLPALIARQLPWIQKQLRRLGDVLKHPEKINRQPMAIELPAIKKVWRIEYQATQSMSLRAVLQADQRLQLRGPIADLAQIQRCLKRWLTRLAREHLVGQLDVLCGEYGFAYDRATIRYQRGRWGSCSSSGTISLNAQLMFLSPAMVRCVLLHELSHTVHLNHGPEFWALLKSCEPDFQDLHATLRRSWSEIPGWLTTAA